MADAGFTVYVPDTFNGGACDPNDPDVWGKLGEWYVWL